MSPKPSRFLPLLSIALLAGAALPGVARAEGDAPSLVGSPPYWQLLATGVDVNPSSLGGELGVAALFMPVEGHELVVGPRISGLLAGGGGETRFDLNTGAELELYFVNAIAPGIAADVVFPSTISPGLAAGDLHFRWEFFVSVRFARFQEKGAWAARLGTMYDTFYKTGVFAGFTLQFNGVPSIAQAFGL